MRAPRTIGAVAEACPATAGRAIRFSPPTAAVAASTTARAQKTGFIAIDPDTPELFTFNSLCCVYLIVPMDSGLLPCPYLQEYLRIQYRLPLHGDSSSSARKSPANVMDSAKAAAERRSAPEVRIEMRVMARAYRLTEAAGPPRASLGPFPPNTRTGLFGAGALVHAARCGAGSHGDPNAQANAYRRQPRGRNAGGRHRRSTRRRI